MTVTWTQTAESHLDGIHEYIARDSKVYAQRMVDRLTARSKQIGEFPYSGSVVPEFESPRIREVIEGQYRIIYVIKADTVDVIAVIHGARVLLKHIADSMRP